jgi:hypothetical protein
MSAQNLNFWDYLATEVAVKLYEDLHSNSEQEFIYGYIPEANEVIAWVQRNLDKLSVVTVQDQIVSIFTENLEHTYPPESFDQTAGLIINRVDIFRKQQLI